MTGKLEGKVVIVTVIDRSKSVCSLALRSTPRAMRLAFAKECQAGDDVLVL